jgi:exonuclease SbcD
VKLLHTSDWHLGQNFKGFERHAEHQVFLNWLLVELKERQIDALLIAGDIFDQANPSAEAQRLFYHFLAQARTLCQGLDIVVIAGNHDSPGRIDAPSAVLDAMGVRVVGQYSARATMNEAMMSRVAIPLTGADGEVGAWVLAVPFLRPGDLARDETGSYQTGVRAAYGRLVEAIEARRSPDQALIVMGHLHVQGGSVSADSERRLVIGGEEALEANIFPVEAAYVALGHLHKPQSVSSEHIRYCGSPLPLSFTEIHYQHQVVEVVLGGSQLVSATSIPIPRPSPLMRVPSEPRPLEEVLLALSELQIEDAPPGLRPLLEVQVLASLVPTDMRARVEAALEGKQVRLTGIQRHRPQVIEASDDGAASVPGQLNLADLKPEKLFDRLLAENPDIAETAGLHQAFAELLDQAQQEAR